jgi:hypothetical protein
MATKTDGYLPDGGLELEHPQQKVGRQFSLMFAARPAAMSDQLVMADVELQRVIAPA